METPAPDGHQGYAGCRDERLTHFSPVVVANWYLYSIFIIKSQEKEMQIPILGVPISLDSRTKVLEKIESFLRENRFHRIVTVNPEFLVLASRNALFRESILNADLRIADGFGLVLAGLLQGEDISRFPGVDLVHDILSLAERDGHAVFLALKKDGLSSYEEIRTVLLQKYPKLFSLGVNNELGSIGNSTIVLCNFGAPEQEYFLEALRNNPGDVRLVVGVGGAFDFLTGKLRRAPQWLRVIGLEWLWRLILQPKRWRRIWNAVIVFPTKVLLKK